VIFADTAYFIALLSPADEWHEAAVRASRGLRQRLVTSVWILVEVGDGLADTANRAWFPEFVADLMGKPQFEIVPAGDHWFRAGLDLYRQRPDKEWSLTDCISFEIMRTRGLTEALTTDHHFTQAGFRALLRE
jgi:hypothetical protein